MESNKSNLDILRSFAVITVMIDHLMPTLAYHGFHVPHDLLEFTAHIGQTGVLAFFVHTSLVLMFSLERLIRTDSSSSVYWRFYIRRAFRIYPLSIASVALVLALGIPAMTWRETPPITPKVVIANVLLIQNLISGQSVLGPMWSLPYEVQMYITLPFLFFLARKPNGPRPITLLIALTSFGAIALAFKTGGRLNMAAYLPCFLAGVLCYSLRNKQREKIHAALWPIWIIGLIVCYCLIHMLGDFSSPVYWIGWILCLLIGYSINLFKNCENPLINNLAQKLALYSYGLYLLHVPVLFLIFDVIKIPNITLACMVYFLTTLLASIATYHTIEKPMMDFGAKISQRFTLARTVAQ